MAFAKLSKVRLEYFPHGQGPERIVFIHGFQASARIWSLVQQALPADRYTTIAFNNRGAGGSEAPPDGDRLSSVPHFAADAFELVQPAGLDWISPWTASPSSGPRRLSSRSIIRVSSKAWSCSTPPTRTGGRFLLAGPRWTRCLTA